MITTWPVATALVIGALVAGGACSSAGSRGGAAGGGSTAAGGAASGGAASGGAPAATGGSPGGGAGQAGEASSGGAAASWDASPDPMADGGAGGAGGVAGTGSAAGVGGAADSGGGTGGIGGQPAGCAGLFCEDFESGALDTGVWDLYQSGGQTVTVQKTTVAHGKYAAQFHARPNVVSGDLIFAKNAPAALRGHHFGRAYLNVTPKPPGGHMLVLIAGSGAFPKAKYLEVGSIQNGWQLSSQSVLGVNANGLAVTGAMEAYSPAGGTLPREKWFCLEWEFNDTPDQIRVFVNGTEDYAYTNISLGGTTTGQAGGFSQFGFGYYIWHAPSFAFDIYYDDIVLDTKRIGCLP